MTPCLDCLAAERDPHGIAPINAGRLCCAARAIADTVRRSGKGYTADDVREKLLVRFTAGLSPLDAHAVRARAHELIAARRKREVEL